MKGLRPDLFAGIVPFVRVAEEKSFARAAASLGLTTAAVSKAVRKLEDDMGAIAAVEEVMAAAMATGAPLHVVHVPSMALGQTEKALDLIYRAQKRGFDITCDFYPYTAFGTGIASEVFSGDWEKKFGMTYKDLEWAKTHERLTPETFAKYRAEGGFVIAHCIPEAAVRAAAAHPASVVGSDGHLDEDGTGHPRSSGTFARVLGHYCRDQKVLSLRDALGKMTYRTAKRFEKRCPDFKRKGRVQVGCDADLVAFDLATVSDIATFDQPGLHSVGFHHVLVHGRFAIQDGQLDKNGRFGKPLRAPVTR